MVFTQINVHDTVSMEVDAGQVLTVAIDLGFQFS